MGNRLVPNACLVRRTCSPKSLKMRAEAPLSTFVCASKPGRECFFFQAGDGIRDLTVTGVQTCALPILVAGGIGTAMGILSGYVGGWVDQIIMRVTDAWLALPAIVFAIFLAAMVGPSMWNIIVILGAVYWTRYARVIRGEVLTLRERDFVKLAEIAGASKLRVIKKHILPNVMNTATVLASLTVGVVIIAEASLSFLGVGVPPPQPAWGLMLSEARPTLMAGQWWLTVFPGACILL